MGFAGRCKLASVALMFGSKVEEKNDDQAEN